MITVNAMGDTCPVPVVKTKKVISSMEEAGFVETLVDNEIAVQNLEKMARQEGYEASSEKLSEGHYRVEISVKKKDVAGVTEERTVCMPMGDNKVVVIDSSVMGDGDEELGKILLKGFIYAISQQEDLPKTILLYNGGARVSCEGSDSIEDLKSMEERGVEILTCGTCLNFYGLTEKLQVGQVTNMYVIAEKMTGASLLVRP